MKLTYYIAKNQHPVIVFKKNIEWLLYNKDVSTRSYNFTELFRNSEHSLRIGSWSEMQKMEFTLDVKSIEIEIHFARDMWATLVRNGWDKVK